MSERNESISVQDRPVDGILPHPYQDLLRNRPNEPLTLTPKQLALVVSVEKLVVNLACHLYRTVGGDTRIVIDAEDLAQAGRIGAIRSAQKFDEGRGVPFSGYASTKIRNAMIDAIRTESRHHKKPRLSLDDAQTPNGHAGNTTSLTESLPSPEPSTEDLILIAERNEQLTAAVANITGPTRQAIQRQFLLGHRQGDIAQDLGIKTSSVKGLVRRGLEKMRAELAETLEVEPQAKNPDHPETAVITPDQQPGQLGKPKQKRSTAAQLETLDLNVQVFRSQGLTQGQIAVALKEPVSSVKNSIRRLILTKELKRVKIQASKSEKQKIDLAVKQLRDAEQTEAQISETLKLSPSRVKASVGRLIEKGQTKRTLRTSTELARLDSEIAFFRSRGLSNKDIAEKISVNISVVRNSVERLLKSSEVQRRRATKATLIS